MGRWLTRQPDSCFGQITIMVWRGEVITQWELLLPAGATSAWLAMRAEGVMRILPRLRIRWQVLRCGQIDIMTAFPAHTAHTAWRSRLIPLEMSTLLVHLTGPTRLLIGTRPFVIRVPGFYFGRTFMLA